MRLNALILLNLKIIDNELYEWQDIVKNIRNQNFKNENFENQNVEKINCRK